MKEEILKKAPKELLCELLFQLGMQVQSQRITQLDGWGAFSSEDLEKAIAKNTKEKEKVKKEYHDGKISLKEMVRRCWDLPKKSRTCK